MQECSSKRGSRRRVQQGRGAWIPLMMPVRMMVLPADLVHGDVAQYQSRAQKFHDKNGRL